MRNKPHGAELLEIARATLLDELLDALPKEKRYTALMVANAMAIAQRESLTGNEDRKRELQLFSTLYDNESIAEHEAVSSDPLFHLNARLAKDTRAGRFDDESRIGLRALLLDQVCARLRLSNPKYLKAAGF